MKKRLLFLGALLVVAAAMARPEHAHSSLTMGCYDQGPVGFEEHEVWGGGDWLVNGPHGWLDYSCSTVHDCPDCIG